MFLAPWRDKTLIGVWHRVVERQPDAAELPGEHLQTFIDEINAVLPALCVTLRDVRMAGFGLVPFGEAQQGGAALSFGHQSKLINHAARDGVSGLISVVSVRYTVARQDACAALDLATAQAGLTRRTGEPISTPLPGGEIDDFAAFLAQARRTSPAWLGDSGIESLVRNYGTLHRRVLDLAAAEPALARRVDGTDVSLAEVAYVCRNEMVTGLADVIFRPTIGRARRPVRPPWSRWGNCCAKNSMSPSRTPSANERRLPGIWTGTGRPEAT